MPAVGSPAQVRLLVAHYRSDVVSGAERSIADMVENLDPCFQVTMLVPGEGALAEFYRRRGLAVWVRPLPSWRRFLPGLHSLRSYRVAREIRAAGFDLGLCNTFAAAGRWSRALQFAGIPNAVYIREYISDRPVHRQILKRMGRVFAVSQDVQRHVSRLAGPEKVLLAYNHIDSTALLERAARHRASGERLLPFAPGQPVIGFAGRITRYKQPDLLVRAAPHILAAVPQARFVLVGSAQPREQAYEASLKQMAEELGIAGQVAFLGNRKDAVELISEMAVLCLPSRNEPLGRVILEAQVVGTPVLGAASGGNPELVEHERSGLLFSLAGERPEEELAAQAVRLLQDEGLRQALAARARDRVQETFSSLRHVRQFEEKLLALAGRPEGRPGVP